MSSDSSRQYPTAPRARLEDLKALDFAAVRSHSDTLRILELLQLEERLRLTVAHFLSLPAGAGAAGGGRDGGVGEGDLRDEGRVVIPASAFGQKQSLNRRNLFG